MNARSRKPWLRSYAPGVPASIEPVTQTLTDMLLAAGERYRRRPAIDFLGSITSYGELCIQVEQFANGLRGLGVVKGDRVALVMPNCPQYIVAMFAVYRLGAIVVPHNPQLTESELHRQLTDHGAKVAIGWDKVCDTLVTLRESTPLEHVVSVSLVEALPLSARLALRLPTARSRRARKATTVAHEVAGTLRWADVATSSPLESSHPKPMLRDTAAILYSGGTTGRPRGVMLSHSNLRANAMQGEAWMTDISYGREVMLGILPLFHGYGLTLGVNLAIGIGARMMLFPRYSDSLVLASMRRAPGTLLAAIPAIYSRLAKAAAAKGVDISSIRYGISGAMELSEDITKEWESVTGGLLVEGYGLTEASPIALSNPFNSGRRHGTLGIPFPSTEIKVSDLLNPGATVPFDEEGELLVRGPQVFSGYWNRPNQTKQVLSADGWLHTGDIVRMSRDGFVTMVDRMSETIVSGGFNVSPGEVEEIVGQHPSVQRCAVVGIPNSIAGDDVVAVVVLKEGEDLDVTAIRSHCKTHLVSYKVPRFVIAAEDLPRSAQGKILRRVIRDELVQAREAG